MYYCLILLLCLAISVRGAEKCPEIKSFKGFNMNAYKGLWFEIARYPDAWEKQGDCGAIEYTDRNGVTYFNLTNVIDKKRFAVTGTLDFKDGVLYHKSAEFTKSEASSSMPVNVIATDYKTWAIAYECIYDSKKGQLHEFCWLLSRYHVPDVEVSKHINEGIQGVPHLDKNKFVWSHLTNEMCLL